MEPRIETIDQVRIPALARAHVDAFPDSALSMLGEDIVQRYYAFRFEASTQLVALGAWDGDRLVGFIVAGTFSAGWKRFVRYHWLALLMAVVRRPWVVVRARFRGAMQTVVNWLVPRRPVTEGPKIPTGSVGVMAIGVSPSARRRGIGVDLMLQTEQRLRAEGVSWMHLSVRSDNAGAIRFYENLGWWAAERTHASTVLMLKAIGTL